MSNKLKNIILAVFGLVLVMAVGCTASSRIGTINYVAEWEEVRSGDPFSTPSEIVRIKAYVTGWVEAPADILIDQSNAAVPETLRQPLWVPSVAYVIIHPSRGVVVLDTGLRPGSCAYGLRPIYWVPCKNEPGSALVAQLENDGFGGDDISAIVLSHFHGDHVSGLESLLSFTDAPLLVSEASIRELRSPFRALSGIPNNMLSVPMRVEVMDSFWRQDPILGTAMDVFGDGSLKLFQTPGHANGHLSALVQGPEDPVLMTFDASHLKANFDLGIPSGAVQSSEQAISSIERLHDVVSQFPSIEIIYGHEPSQWSCVSRSVEIGSTKKDAC